MSEGLAPQRAANLRAYTLARVGLGRTGVSQQTMDLLAFQKAHALARDAVHARLDPTALAAALTQITRGETVLLHSMAPDRATYLQRPDLGRKLDERSKEELGRATGDSSDLALVVADGLSALAIQRHAAPFMKELISQLKGWNVAPVCIVEQGRVAIGDEIGAMLHARLSVVLIGERPGLSAPDSMGAYVTWEPRPGRTDAERNCLSNIRSEGLSYGQAAAKLVDLLAAARGRQLTGVALKQPTLTRGDD
jgi:ethanolamine ammonia-lyase small subunit